MPKISYKYRTKAALPSMLFRALANDIRLQILGALRESERCVAELTEELGYDQTTISHNLSLLTSCGFVRSQRVGQNKIYSLSSRRIKRLLSLVEEHLRENRSQIIGLFRRMVVRGRGPGVKV